MTAAVEDLLGHMEDQYANERPAQEMIRNQEYEVSEARFAFQRIAEIHEHLEDDAVYDCGGLLSDRDYFRKLAVSSRTERTISIPGADDWSRGLRLRVSDLEADHCHQGRGTGVRTYRFGRFIREEVSELHHKYREWTLRAERGLGRMLEAVERGEYPYSESQLETLRRLERLYEGLTSQKPSEKADWNTEGF